MGFSQKGYDAEILALDILEKQGYEIIYAPEKLKRNNIFVVDAKIKKMFEDASKKLLDARKKYNAPADHHTKNISDKVRKIMKKESDEFYKVDKIHHKALNEVYEKKNKIISLMMQNVGKSIMPEIDKNAWIKFHEEKRDSEDPTSITYIEGYHQQCIDSLKSGKSHFELSYVDIFCKKGTNYYVFDVKHKTFNEKKNPNQFGVTNYEVLNYARIVKENKIKLRILIIAEKGKKSLYKMFEWSDFTYSKNFNPHKTKKTFIRLKEDLDLSKFQEWKCD